MTKEIHLGFGKVALVDKELYDYINIWEWIESGGYARRFTKNALGGYILMHRLIKNPPDDMLIDHINGNKLDNRSINLRICTHTENMWNRGKPINNTSGYKGVHWYPGKWRATIGVRNECKQLGGFKTALEAAEAYNIAALEYHGEFAYQNDLTPLPGLPYDYSYDESWRYL